VLPAAGLSVRLQVPPPTQLVTLRTDHGRCSHVVTSGSPSLPEGDTLLACRGLSALVPSLWRVWRQVPNGPVFEQAGLTGGTPLEPWRVLGAVFYNFLVSPSLATLAPDGGGACVTVAGSADDFSFFAKRSPYHETRP
jgi:hypothetical protein